MKRGGRSLFTNLAWSIAIGMLVAHLIGVGWYGHERMLARAETFALSTIDRALAYRDLDAATAAALDSFTGEEFKARFGATPLADAGESWRHNDEVQAAVAEALQTRDAAVPAGILLGYYYTGRQAWFRLSVPVAEGRWLNITARTDATRFGPTGASTSIVTLLIIVMVLFLTRRATRFFTAFADAAESIGRTGTFTPLQENRGPREVRRASAAFNAMQSRVQSLISERTQMLAAVSHDLRTIATRLQLRIERISDETQREKAEQDLAAMSVILEESLNFARDELAEEPRTLLDLGSLLQAIVDDACDTGGDAALDVEVPVRITGQPVALRRAFANLVDNAVRYGQQARVVLKADGVVEIHDKGQGIAPEDVERAQQPFVRLENSRNRDTGGTGLGLTIARAVIQRHSGRLEFSRSAEGFLVRVVLPVSSAESRAR